MPDELVKQVPVLKKLIGDLGIKIVELEGYEADDIIGTLAKRFSCPTDIVTGDRDSLQLIDDTSNVLFSKWGISVVGRYDKERLFEDGFETPSAIIDYKALRGDASDNIPGIPGIGERPRWNFSKPTAQWKTSLLTPTKSKENSVKKSGTERIWRGFLTRLRQ